MKPCFIALTFLGAVSASAQWIVHDPANTAVNAAIQSAQAANHVETMRQRAEQLEKLNREIRQLEDLLATQRRIRDVIGDPALAGAEVARGLGAKELAVTYGETMQAARRLSDAVGSLRRTADGIYRQLDDRTLLGREFSRQTAPYLRYAVVDRQVQQTETVFNETEARITELQREQAAAVAALRDATTQAEVDKLSVRIGALNGQLALATARRRDEAEKLQAARIQNENQADKERVDLLEKQNAEERQTLEAVNAWQSSLRLTPTNYSRP